MQTIPQQHGATSNPILLGMAVHAGLVFLACLIAPLAMGSNIWPLATVFWGAIAVPAAIGTGALMGWIAQRARIRPAAAIVLVSGVIAAAIVGVLITLT